METNCMKVSLHVFANTAELSWKLQMKKQTSSKANLSHQMQPMETGKTHTSKKLKGKYGFEKQNRIIFRILSKLVGIFSIDTWICVPIAVNIRKGNTF